MGKPFDDAQKEKENARKVIQVEEVLDGDSKDIFAGLEHDETAARDVSKLFCFGCAHSASSEDFPGKPSGERPCFFCVRNPEREKWQEDFRKSHGSELKEWYDNSPIAFYPMDVYQTIDMIEQQERWDKKTKGDPNWNIPERTMRFG